MAAALQVESYFGNVNPIGERSCYDEGKRAAETLTFDYMREHGVEVCPLRRPVGPQTALLWGRLSRPHFVRRRLTGLTAVCCAQRCGPAGGRPNCGWAEAVYLGCG